jgi:multicomponent Na+:H+ antiporter subunit D
VHRFLTLPILVPMLLGIGLLVIQPKDRKVRNTYIMATVIATAVLSGACIVLTYLQGSDLLACILVRFSESFSISLRIDGVSMVYGAIVSALWPLITIYALDYMSHEGHESRFFGFWLIAFGVVLGIAYSEDFLSLYLFYELLTLTTLPLVMHAMDEKARYAGRKYLIYSLSGAAFAFIGIVFLLNYGVGHLNFTYGGVLDMNRVAGNEQTLLVVFVGAFFGFGVKAAIFPFHGWLPDASVAPTPVSALLHAVAVVKAGAFAVLRLIYFGYGAEFLRGTWAQTVVMGATIATIVYGSARALRTPHLKRRLAFSTVSNLSYILFALTLMSPAGLLGGLTHMVYHAVIKITMFCCAGAIIHKSGREYVYELENFGRVMPVVFITFTVSSFALIGLPPLGGFAGKWMISEGAVASGNPLAYVGIGALILSTLLTTLYLMTIVVRAYFPIGKLDAEALEMIHDPGKAMTVPLVLLTTAGMMLALCSDRVIGFLTLVAQGAL